MRRTACTGKCVRHVKCSLRMKTSALQIFGLEILEADFPKEVPPEPPTFSSRDITNVTGVVSKTFCHGMTLQCLPSGSSGRMISSSVPGKPARRRWGSSDCVEAPVGEAGQCIVAHPRETKLLESRFTLHKMLFQASNQLKVHKIGLVYKCSKY